MSYLRIRCIYSQDTWWTVGETYDVWKETELFYHIYDNDEEDSMICKKNLCEVGSDTRALFTRVLYESTSTVEEEEEFQRIERKQQEAVDCSVAVAHHIHELQKWLKHIGCDDEMELKITSENIWVSPCAEELYEAKEGGVGTLIEYMRHIGGANKCLEKMEEL